MSQRVIAARDFDLYLNFDAIGVAFKVETGANFTSNITGNTEDIGAFSTDEPIGTDNGGNTYDISFQLQQAEAQTILDALAAATAGTVDGSIVHIRQIVEACTITVVWKKKRDVPPSSTVETYTHCTGASEGDNVERRASETLKSWSFRARGKKRTSVLL